MKKINLGIWMAVFVLAICLFSGCGKNEGVKTGDIAETEGTALPEGSVSPAAGETEEPQKADDKESQKTDAEPEKEIDIYTINSTTLEVEDAKASFPLSEEITAPVLVDAVVDSFEDYGIEIGIDHVEEQKDAVVVSFVGADKGKAPLCNIGSGVEGTILDCISQSLIDNLDYCEKVIFRVEDKAYESGVFVFGYDQAYKWK